MAKENRNYERLELTGVVESNSINILKGIDFSMSGMRVLTDKKIDDDHIIDMSFSIPGIKNRFSAEAKVVWQKKIDKGFDTGLEFKKINVNNSDV